MKSTPSSSASIPVSIAEVTGREFSMGEYKERDIKRQRQGLLVDEMSSSNNLDVAVYNLGNLA